MLQSLDNIGGGDKRWIGKISFFVEKKKTEKEKKKKILDQVYYG